MGPTAVAGLIGESGRGITDPWRLEGVRVVLDLLDRILATHHATSPTTSVASETVAVQVKSTSKARS